MASGDSPSAKTFEAQIARLFAMDEVAWARHAFALAFWPMLAGLVLCVLAKLWFCDRMVWLYEEMAAADARLREWVA